MKGKTMTVSLTKAKQIAKDPDAYSTRELDEALTTIVESDRLSEKQVSNLQAKIDPVLRDRIENGRTYPVGTNVRDIECFDRGIKVVFGCKEHTGIQYMCKEPFTSNVFPANEHTRWAEFGTEVMECEHKFSDDVWVTVRPYTYKSF